MPASGIGGLGDSLLYALLQGSARRDLGALFLPPQLAHSTSGLSGGELATVLGTARTLLVGLATAATALDLASPTSAFFSATVTSSNPSIVQASVIAGTSPDTTPAPASYTFTVSQLAAAQANVGSALTSSAISTFSLVDTFRVTQNGSSTDLSFTVLPTDTNATVLAKMASAINAQTSLGVTAEVRTDTVAGTSQLVVQAKVTGSANAFSLTDVVGNSVTKAGVGSATTAATNASYTQNGVALTASTNDLYVGDDGKLKVTLLATTSTPVVVTVGGDTDLVGNSITSLVNAFNAAKTFFDAQPDLYPGLAAQLNTAVSRLGAQLANVGILVGKDRTLSIDATRLANALAQTPDTVQEAFGAVGGLAKELSAIGDTHLRLASAARNPLPPFEVGYGPQILAGLLAKRLGQLHLTGLLVDQLV